ncbi:hypothetical protein Tco_0580711 [Tanacetum coccineum]
MEQQDIENTKGQSPRRGWNVEKDVIDALKKRANRYVVFGEYEEGEIDEIQNTQDRNKMNKLKSAMFDINDNKAPCPDGYTYKIYKQAWGVIRVEVCATIKEIFVTGTAWGGHDWKNGAQTQRVAFIIDIREAYNTVKRHDDFKGRGLRQGDPISSYIVTLVREVFNLIMQHQIKMKITTYCICVLQCKFIGPLFSSFLNAVMKDIEKVLDGSLWCLVERNSRLFTSEKKDGKEILAGIINNIRFELANFKSQEVHTGNECG